MITLTKNVLEIVMSKRVGNTIFFENGVGVVSSAATVGKKEHEGPLGEYFNNYSDDEFFGQKSFEKAESEMQRLTAERAIKNAGLTASDIDIIFGGDLLNQCVGSTFGLRNLNIPFAGVYGACSTMALSLSLAALMVEGGFANYAAAITSSHFCSAEKQFRYPLEYGSQRTPLAQWTVTGSGCAVLGHSDKNIPKIKAVTIGKITDYGVTDINNMGAAMAPDDVKIRPYPRHEGMVFFYTQIQYLRGFRALFKDFSAQKNVEKTVNKIRLLSSIY